ncbi:hypothetical protein EGW08_003625, partial [Elysia chlorotica]
ATSLHGTVLLSLLFSAIFAIGIAGNLLVIAVIVRDSKMRQSVTNLMIINLAIADLVIMFLNVPEMLMFVMGGAWLLGPAACKANRFILTSALYCSVLSLLALCVERFIAIVFPLKAHELCSRRKIVGAILFIWPLALGCGLPVALYNVEVTRGRGGLKLCLIRLPGEDWRRSLMLYKFTESALFYFIPMVLQVGAPYCVCSYPNLHRKKNPASDTIRARKGVVKMLISSVLLYFLSYSPLQARLLYKSLAARPGAQPTFFDSMDFFVLVMVMTLLNSAANPVLYAIFSQNFRRNFQRCLCC